MDRETVSYTTMSTITARNPSLVVWIARTKSMKIEGVVWVL